MVEQEKNIVIFSTADWNEPYWTNKQHTAKALSNLGHNIIFVESFGLRKPKIGSSKDFSRLKERLKTGMKNLFFGGESVEDNILVLAPLVVPAAQRNKLIQSFNNKLLKYLIKREIDKLPCRDVIVWTYHPYIIDLIDSIDYSNLLYHCVDDISAVPGVDKELFKKEENQLLKICDKVYATNEYLTKRCFEINKSSEYLPNVVDFEHFSNSSKKGLLSDQVKLIPSPRLVYHGVLSDFKVDFELLYHLAMKRPEYNLVIIGDEKEGQSSKIFEKLKKLDNVFHLGYVEYKELPCLLRDMDVALLPTLINEYTRSMFPMKYFEYTAASLPVVSTKLSFTDSLENERLLVASDFDDFTLSVDKQLKKGKLSIEEAAYYVGENTWEQRTKTMLDTIVEL